MSGSLPSRGGGVTFSSYSLSLSPFARWWPRGCSSSSSGDPTRSWSGSSSSSSGDPTRPQSCSSGTTHRLLQKFDFPSMKFTLYFLGFEDKKEIPGEKNEHTAWTFSRRATIELTHNWGTEVDENQAYHNGNSDPRGFGHLGIAVPDVYIACKRFEELGVKFVKKVDDGKMKGLAFIQDPDGYWIEILSPNQMLTIVP